MPPPYAHPSPGWSRRQKPPPPPNAPGTSQVSGRRWREAAGTVFSFLHDLLQILSLFFSPEAWPSLHVAKHRLPVSPTGISLLFSPSSRSDPWPPDPGKGQEQVADTASRWVFVSAALFFIFGDWALTADFLAAATGWSPTRETVSLSLGKILSSKERGMWDLTRDSEKGGQM